MTALTAVTDGMPPLADAIVSVIHWIDHVSVGLAGRDAPELRLLTIMVILYVLMLVTDRLRRRPASPRSAPPETSEIFIQPLRPSGPADAPRRPAPKDDGAVRASRRTAEDAPARDLETARKRTDRTAA